MAIAADNRNGTSAVPLVSVIMPFLNGERFIAAAIDSVLAQTLERWELLLVDDGSSDGSRAIAEDYARREPARIRVLQHLGRVNRGIAASRNLGMQAARGCYLAFLDADDLYRPKRLERHLQYLEADPGLGVVLSAEVYWHSWQQRHRRTQVEWDRVMAPAVEPGRRIEPPAFIVGTLLTAGAPMPPTCSITFRRAAFEDIGGAPDAFRGHYEDQALFCKLLLAYPVLVIGEPLALYRQHVDSITQANAAMDRVPGSAAHAARTKFLTWLQDHLARQGYDLPELQAWLGAELEALRVGSVPEPLERRARLRRFARRAAVAVLPDRVVGHLARLLHRLNGRRVRRRVTQRMARYESNAARSSRAIREYWNARIDDTRLSDDPPGTAGYYAALDGYRLRKNDYLPRVVDFDEWAGRDVLEIGCGPGLDLVRFVRGGAQVTGIDIAPAALELAKGYCRVAGVQASLLEADGAHLPFDDASFDLVYCHGVLSFVSDPIQVIAEAHRVLRPGGQAILMVYNRRSWMHWLLKLPGSPLGQGHSDAPGFRTYTPSEFERMLAPFAERHLLFERFAPTTRNGGPVRWLRPFGWHLLAFCRKPA